MKFGVFDHMDDAAYHSDGLYADRLRLVEAYDCAGLHGYHLAEHHATPLGSAASPGLFLAAVAQRTNRLRFGPMVHLLPSAVARQLPLAVPTPRCRAAHHRQLSADLR
jgi:alkanesulfonate monooxygenase SsuD/methylene tetrahydromethanopterin reductase-like flavin-dependent oxidoreductase (luciferase family)